MSQRPHATFSLTELPVVLSHYDLGVIESITEFPRGSRKSPKVGIVCQRGKFMLKRRAVQRGGLDRVAFAHAVQQALARANFPAPRLVPTRGRGDTLLQLEDAVYEMFEFVSGQRYARTPAQARAAGAALAAFHKATENFTTDLPTPQGDYHDAPGIRTGLHTIGAGLKSHDSFVGHEAELATLVQVLLEAYDDAAKAVNQAYDEWIPRIIHSDWHPGNVLYRDGEIAAVCDYDSVRRAPRIVDVANGALQFAMVGAGDPETWPDHLDDRRVRDFLAGYKSAEALEAREVAHIPSLMVESLVAECVPPITQTGSVGRYSGFRVLQVVRRMVRWIDAESDRLVGALDD